MNRFKKEHVLLDFNLLLWMPNIDLSKYNIKDPNKDKFNRGKEQQAFSELLEMRSKGEIEISVPDVWPKSFVNSLRQHPELKGQVASFYHNRISISHTVVFEGSEVEEFEERALDKIISNLPTTKKKHDDPAMFVLADFVNPNITHLATCDTGFIEKIELYDQSLLEDKEIENFRRFRRKNKKLIVNLPSEILKDLKKQKYISALKMKTNT